MTRQLREGFTTGSAAAAAAMAAAHSFFSHDVPTAAQVLLPPIQVPFSPMAHVVRQAPLRQLALLTHTSATASHGGDHDHNATPQGAGKMPHPPPLYHRLTIPVQNVWRDGFGAAAAVVKDGGDDPDATHGATILAWVGITPPENALPGTSSDTSPPVSVKDPQGADAFSPTGTPFASSCHSTGIFIPGFPNAVTLYGGKGVGVATLPGLPIAVGEPAINPEPRRQIAAAVCEVAAKHAYAGALHIVITVPDGEIRAKRSMNSRLGIRGGISILGTCGIVRPYSHAAWQATIKQSFAIAKAKSLDTVLLATGRRSERLLQAHYPKLPPFAGIQVADFAAFSLRCAVQTGCNTLIWGCFPGKLLKLAQGLEWTHASTARSDIPLIARYCQEAGATHSLCDAVAVLPTAVGAFAFLAEQNSLVHAVVLERLAHKAYAHMERWIAEAQQQAPREADKAESSVYRNTPSLKPRLILHIFSLERSDLLFSVNASVHKTDA